MFHQTADELNPRIHLIQTDGNRKPKRGDTENHRKAQQKDNFVTAATLEMLDYKKEE